MKLSLLARILIVLLLPGYLFGCSDGDDNPGGNNAHESTISVGAASHSLLPTVNGTREYL